MPCSNSSDPAYRYEQMQTDIIYLQIKIESFKYWTAPPRFTRTPVDQTGVSGGVASFICQATGDPRPKIVWNKKGKKVSNQRFEVIEFDDGSGSVLRIQPLRTPRDEAIYECVASNNVGEISVSTRLTVLRVKDAQIVPNGSHDWLVNEFQYKTEVLLNRNLL
ncbi:hypothetical protein STEG23_006811 [Scotinomys teguina]